MCHLPCCLKVLHRCRYHDSQIFGLMLKGRDEEAPSYLVQFLRCLHQVQLDGGSWSTGMRLFPKSDPIEKPAFGGTHKQLEAIASCEEALRKLQHKSKEQQTSEEQQGGNEKKGDGKGGRADKPGADGM